jgi:hypothetical protein
VLSGVQAITRRRTAATDFKKLALSLNFNAIVAAAEMDPTSLSVSGAPVVDLAAEEEKMLYRERAIERRATMLSLKAAGAGGSGPMDMATAIKNALKNAAAVRAQQTPTDEDDDDGEGQAQPDGSASARFPSPDDGRPVRQYTHALVTPHTQSRLVDLLGVSPSLLAAPSSSSGSQSARAILQGGGSQFLNTAAGPFVRNAASVTAGDALMQPRARQHWETKEEVSSFDPSSSVQFPRIRGARGEAASTSSDKPSFNDILSHQAAFTRSLLLLRRLAAEVRSVRNAAAASATDGEHQHQLTTRRLLPRLETRLAAQIEAVRSQAGVLRANLSQWTSTLMREQQQRVVADVQAQLQDGLAFAQLLQFESATAQ